MPEFDALQIAREILDHEPRIQWKNGRLRVGTKHYTRKESQSILDELCEMFRIYRRTSMGNKTMHKLEALLLVCNRA